MPRFQVNRFQVNQAARKVYTLFCSMHWQSDTRLRNLTSCLRIGACFLAITSVTPLILHAQSPQETPASNLSQAKNASIQGYVRDFEKRPIAGATVFLQAKGDPSQKLVTPTDSTGAYHFSSLLPGEYVLRAEMQGYNSVTPNAVALGANQSKTIDLVFEPARTFVKQGSSASRPEFFDEPHFTVAGVVDTTNLGGHGSDAVVRNRDALARDTASLRAPARDPALDSAIATEEGALREQLERQPESFAANSRLGKLLTEQGEFAEAILYLERASKENPTDNDNAFELALAYTGSGEYTRARAIILPLLAAQEKSHREKAGDHHLLAEVDEKLNQPLEASQQYQRAAELEPSEPNIFDWGSEMLLHHAPEPAIEIFAQGRRLFPHSVRMLTALGAAWYAHGSYSEAARYLCEAADLNPDDPAPYLFMGKMLSVEANEPDGIADRLARFGRLHPENAMANYYYALSLWKRGSPPTVDAIAQAKSLLQAAVQLDPTLGLAYLQLGIVYAEENDFSDAIAAYHHAIEAAPTLEQPHYRLAQAYRRVGDAEQAKSELLEYEKISKENTDAIERQRREIKQFVYQMRDQAPPQRPK